VPSSGHGSPGVASLVPEQLQNRPLVCGLQVQNFDDDALEGVLAGGYVTIGTLGCFVRLKSGRIGMLSNNHVLAGENRGRRRKDRILQSGAAAFDASMDVAVLDDFEDIVASPAGASIAAGSVVFNEIDAATAEIMQSIVHAQATRRGVLRCHRPEAQLPHLATRCTRSDARRDCPTALSSRSGWSWAPLPTTPAVAGSAGAS
jgi:hypothetical protein